MVAADRLSRTLGSSELAWLIDRVRTRLERGAALDGTVTLTQATPAQRQAVSRLLGRRIGQSASVSVPLPALDRALRDAGLATDLRAAVEALTGPICERDAVRAAEEEQRALALKAARSGRHAGSDWYENWLSQLDTDGTLTRLVRRGETHLLGHAAAILERLPGDGVPLPVLAEQATGDTKALSGTPLSGLVLRAWALRERTERPVSAHDRRSLWEKAGVVVDDLASQVLVLRLRVRGADPLAGWLNQAAEQSIPFRVTLHQAMQMPVAPSGGDLYVCENPAVLRAATALPSGAALICTEGQPSAACQRLLSAAGEMGTRLHWRNDFDWPGLRMTAKATDRYTALPWRMAAADYKAALSAGDSEPLKGTPSPSPWDPDLAVAMVRSGRTVMEERLIPLLLADLSR